MSLTRKFMTAGTVVGATLGALAVFNKMTESMAGELDTVLTGEERRYPWKYGDIFYEVKGDSSAKPLVLIHGFGPGASSYEWRKNVDTLAEQFQVFVIDLLGFGLSDHPVVDFTSEIFTDLVHDFIKEVVAKPAIVVAHGLTCAYVIACAYRRPQVFERLVLVSPSSTLLQEVSPDLLNTLWKRAFSVPIVGQFIYNLLTSRQAIRSYYDRQGYHNPSLITDELLEYIYTSAHQHNSHYPLAAFLSNHLATDVHEPLARLQIPIVALWGREDQFAPSEVSTAFKKVNPRIEIHILENASYQIQEEQAARFNRLVTEFASAIVG